jgi:HD superfamily phosphohydrolase
MNGTVRAGLWEGFTDPVRDVLWGHIYLTPAMAVLIRTPAFIRLSRIFQLGPAYGIYPGATHTRASHSIGVYHLSRRLLLDLAEKGADSWLSITGVRSFLCASLLHDLGHFPYTHSLKDLPLRSHEELTGSLILQEPLKSLVGRTGADPYLTAAIVDTKLPSQGSGELIFYRKLLSGVLDPDKLDYLNRDARYCGVPYGMQDVDFIYNQLRPNQERGVDIYSRGVPSVESILFSKYLMYRTVYWHRSVRSATAMIKKVLLAGLADGAITQEELYDLDDQGLFALLSSRSHPLFPLAFLVREGQYYPAAAEFPFDKTLHENLQNIGNRSRYEQALAAELSESLGRTIRPAEIIIDVPEPVSFETGLHVIDEGDASADFRPDGPGSPMNGKIDGPYDNFGVFTTQTIEGFIKSLRIIRIFVDPIYEIPLKSNKWLPEILHIKKKWLHL